MQTTITPQSRPPSARRFKPQGVYVHVIQGRYRPLTVQQIALAWWLYREGHLTARQFRIYFAAHEMHERRRYTKLDDDRRPRTPTYGPEEVQALIGSKAAEREILADIRALARVGLVKIKVDSIEFALSVDQIAVEQVEDLSGFWAFFNELPNRARRVPVPRRTLRALAKGLSRGTAAMVLALMIRSLYWHQDDRESRGIARNDDSGGRYRIDGRTKCAWIAEVFGVDRKTISTARGQLIERGWLRPIECQQWELNKWGQRYTIDVDAFGPAKEQGTVGRQDEELLWAMAEQDGDQEATVGQGSEREAEEGAEEQGGTSGNFPSPARDFTAASPSPCLNSSSSSTKKDLITRKPAPATRSGPTRGDRKKGLEVVGGRGAATPVLRDVVRADLDDDERLEELYQQALQAGHPVRGEKGRLEFYALAERARAHGKEAPRLFAWLLKENRFDYITQVDEDRALARIKAGVRAAASRHREQAQEKQQGGRKERRGQGAGTYDAFLAGLGEDERFVHACIVTGRQRGLDPLRIAMMAGWTRQRWEAAKESYELAEQQRWTQVARDTGSLFLNE